MKTLQIRQPDDMHCHLREGEALNRTVFDQSAQFARSIIMPNLKVPVTTVDRAQAYYHSIQAAVPAHGHFTPLMTLYLTDSLSVDEIHKAQASGFIHAIKLYPQGATTLSESGIANIKAIYPQLAAMQERGMVLCVHGEVVTDNVDVFDREAVFIEECLRPIVAEFPQLKIVLEHITTQHAVDFVKNSPKNVAATITPHHLLCNRNDLLVGGIKPHLYCLPILKTELDRQALVAAATSGDPHFFLGTDSAPHARSHKESTCGCAGIYSAHAAIELYAEVFSQQQALDRLEDFSSRFGAEFYGLDLNTRTVTLVNKPWIVPEYLEFGNDTLIPFYAGQSLQWQRVDND